MSEIQSSPAVGHAAPGFILKDKDGRGVSLISLTADYIVIFFYPKDSTPGCTIEAKAFTSLLKSFKKLGAEVIGISGGDEKTKTKFCLNAKLDVILLSDPEGKVGRAYGSYGQKKFMGKNFEGFLRKTFLIGPERRIIKIYDKVKVQGHAEAVLNDLDGLVARAGKV